MHEIGMCEAVLDAVERRAAGRPVTGVTVRIGALHRVVPEAFAQSFEMVAAGSVAQGAELGLVFLPVRAHCRSCGGDLESDEQPVACPYCGQPDLDLLGGDELILESIAVPMAAVPVTAAASLAHPVAPPHEHPDAPGHVGAEHVGHDHAGRHDPEEGDRDVPGYTR